MTERWCALGRSTNWCMPSGAWQGVHNRVLAGHAQFATFFPATVAVGRQNAWWQSLLYAAYPSLNDKAVVACLHSQCVGVPSTWLIRQMLMRAAAFLASPCLMERVERTASACGRAGSTTGHELQLT